MGADESALDLFVDLFEEEGQAGRPRPVEAFFREAVAQSPLLLGSQAHSALLLRLVEIDLEYRWKTRGPIDLAFLEEYCLEGYARRLPQLGPPAGWPEELIAEEYRVRRCWGDDPDADSYLRRFPARGASLQVVLVQVDAEVSRQPAPVPQIPGYQGVEKIGRGDLGVVYKAHQIHSSRLAPNGFLTLDR